MPGMVLAGVAALAVFSTLSAAVQERPAAQAASAAGRLEGQIVRQPAHSFGVAALMGADVVAADGRPVGEVRDVLVTEDGRVAGILLGLGGFMGFGDKVVALRMDQVTITRMPEAGRVIVTAHFDPVQLSRAPEFVPLPSGHGTAALRR